MDLMTRRNMLMRGGDSTDWKALFMGLVDGTISGNIVLESGVVPRAYAFYNTGIESITLPADCVMATCVFAYCYGLKDINYSGALKLTGTDTFNNCQALRTPIIVSNDTTDIKSGSFFNCYNIPYVDFGSGITSISNQATRYMLNCQYVIIRATTPPTLGILNFNDASATGQTYPIYVPDASVAAYKAANNWSALASRIFPISDLNNT